MNDEGFQEMKVWTVYLLDQLPNLEDNNAVQKAGSNSMNWIIANKEWLFSGLLVAAPIALFGWLFARHRSGFSQNQKAGDGSVNIQVGGNIDLAKGNNDGNSKPKGRR